MFNNGIMFHCLDSGHIQKSDLAFGVVSVPSDNKKQTGRQAMMEKASWQQARQTGSTRQTDKLQGNRAGRSRHATRETERQTKSRQIGPVNSEHDRQAAKHKASRRTTRPQRHHAIGKKASKRAGQKAMLADIKAG